MAKVSRPHLLVVGGTGFIGHGLLMAAKKRGWQLSSVSLKYPKKNRYLSKVKYILADVRNLLQLKKKLRDRYDYVVNLSGYGAKKLTTNENKNILETHFLGVVNLVSVFEKKKYLNLYKLEQEMSMDSPKHRRKKIQSIYHTQLMVMQNIIQANT